MPILHLSSRKIGSNVIFIIFGPGSLPAKLQSQRQLESVLLTWGLPFIPAGRRSFSKRQRDSEKCVFPKSQGGLTRKHNKLQWNTHSKIIKFCPQRLKSELQRRQIRVQRIIWRRFLLTNIGSAEKMASELVSQTPFQNYAYFIRVVTKNEKLKKYGNFVPGICQGTNSQQLRH